MYAISMNPVSSFAITRDLGQVNEVLGLTGDLLTETRAIIRAQRVAEDLENKEHFFSGTFHTKCHQLTLMQQIITCLMIDHWN